MKLIVLDRDGVINIDSENYIRNKEQWIPIPGSLEAICRLNNDGYKVAIATNQSGIARGYFDVCELNAMHQKMHKMLAKLGGHIDLIAFCPHGPEDNCNCRKPAPGLYREIGHRLGMSLHNVPVIGDSDRDLVAAYAEQMHPILVRTGKGEKTETALDAAQKIPVFDDLAEAVDTLLQGNTL